MIITKQKTSGFTLIELMLAMSIAALLSLSLYASMAVAFRANRSAEAAVRPARIASVAMELVSRDLESVMPPSDNLSGHLYGSPDSIEYHTLGEDVSPREQTSPMQEGFRRVELFVKSDVDPPTLVRRVQRNLLATVQTNDPNDEETLCRGVHAFTLRYFDGTTWQTDWDTTANDYVLPSAIEITLELQIDPSQPAKEAERAGKHHKITRVIPLACAAPAATTTTTGGAP